MRYLKVFTDFAKVIEPINDAEAGRLFRAMLKYAECGETPQFSGNEKYIWPAAQLNIDREAAFCEKQRRNAHGGKDKEPNEANSSQQEPNEAKASQTSHKDKDKDKDNKLLGSQMSFVPSISGADDAGELERMIEGLNLHLYQGSDRLFAKAIENAIRTMYHAEHIRVNGRTIPQASARNVLRTLTIDHIDYILAKLEEQEPEEPVNNGQAYLISCIYNAPADFVVNEKRQFGRR